ncbi:hypothetical protein PVL29_025930 [Vitis rotundifolia]|uniref:40S ribosomal protein S8 n=1 Tax=Vitis rotundifolia TaxID=103349 RepID=A0AA38YLA3_VITRO|nr:hypothetical protein PVL29_025930 [Vitis rotundifolia]
MHKRRATSGKKKAWKKKRKYLSSNKIVRRVHVRGGNVKWRALRLDIGNYSWGSEVITRKTCILDVIYNASNNELVDAAPVKQWYLQHYGVDIASIEETKKSSHVLRKLEKHQFGSGRLLACISSRPSQCKELEFYTRKI